MMLRVLDSIESRRDGCDAGVPAHMKREQYSTELWTKALYTEQRCRYKCFLGKKSEDTQSMGGFRGLLSYVVISGMVIADGEA